MKNLSLTILLSILVVTIIVFYRQIFVGNEQQNVVAQINQMPVVLGAVDELSQESCDNYSEVEDFKKPVPIIWVAKLDGCLVSCEGASFSRINKNVKYPRFSAYMRDQKTIPEEYLTEGLVLRITGEWLGVDVDHPRTVFNNQCVPIVDINKIEIL